MNADLYSQPNRDKEVALPELEGGAGGKLESGYLVADDGERLYYRYWPCQPPAPLIFYLHGIEGHGGWFEGTATYLQQHGIAIWAPDRRGAGRNEGHRGDLLSYSQLLSDAYLMLRQARLAHRQGPLFIMGNCWGAKLAIILACQKEAGWPEMAGLILTSPALKVKLDVALSTKLHILLSWLTRSQRRFPIPLTAEMFTDHSLYLDFIRQDRWRLTEATASFFMESMKLTHKASRAAGRLSLPLLVLQSGKDQIVNVDAVRDWFNRAACHDKTLCMFPQAAHSLDFDSNCPGYKETLSGWIIQRARELLLED